MKFIVNETTHKFFAVEAPSGAAAVAARKRGQGTPAREAVVGYTAQPGAVAAAIAPTPQPVPCEDWPFWAKALKLLAKPQDKGIGDVVARTIGAEKSDAFKKWYKKIFGKDCGCTGRLADWNTRYPLPYCC